MFTSFSASTCNANMRVNTFGVYTWTVHCIFMLQMQGVCAEPAETAHVLLVLYVKMLEIENIKWFRARLRETEVSRLFINRTKHVAGSLKVLVTFDSYSTIRFYVSSGLVLSVLTYTMHFLSPYYTLQAHALLPTHLAAYTYTVKWCTNRTVCSACCCAHCAFGSWNSLCIHTSSSHVHCICYVHECDMA